MGKENKGFIKLDRNIFEHWIFQDAEKFRAFVDLIQLARWKEEKLLIGNEVVTVPRGSYYTSELKLAERWNWSRKRTREFLKLLENEKMITKKGTTKGTMLTIENYRVYQDEGTTISTSKGQRKNSERTAKDTSKGQQRNSEGYTKEEIKEIKEFKEREERKEESRTVLPPVSFPTDIHKKIYENLGDITYRTWFIDTDIEELENEIVIRAATFKKQIIDIKYRQPLEIWLKKKIRIEERKGDYGE